MPFWILFRWRKVVETFWNSAWQDAGWCSHETIERRNCDINSVTCSVERFTLQPAVGTAGSRYNKHDTSLTQRPDRLRTLTWDKDWQRQRCVRGVKNIYMLEMLGEMILSFCLCLHRANTHTHTHIVQMYASDCGYWTSHSPGKPRGVLVCDFQALTGSLLLRVAGWVVAVGVQGLRPLLAGRVARLVGMPGLFAVVAELSTAAFSAAHQPGTAGTARGDDGKSDRRRQREECSILW